MHRERDREDERVEGGLDRAEDQRHEAQLRLEVVGAAGRLPDVLGLRVALVPDLAEEGAPGELRVRVVERVALDGAVRALDDDAVGARRDERGVRGPARRPGTAAACARRSGGAARPSRRGRSVAKLRSRVEEPIERIGEPWSRTRGPSPARRSASARGRARNHAETAPFSSPTITVVPPRPHSTAVSGAGLTCVVSVSWAVAARRCPSGRGRRCAWSRRASRRGRGGRG